MLMTAWLVEKMTLERYQRQAVEDGESERDQLQFAPSSDLVVADNWSLTKCVVLEAFDGDYDIEVLRVHRGQAAFIDAIRLYRHDTVEGTPRICTASVSVDSGWLLFLNQTYADEILLKQYRGETSECLSSLSADRPLCLWLKHDDQAIAGVVIASGNGDGEYEIAYTVVNGLVTEVVVEFGVN